MTRTNRWNARKGYPTLQFSVHDNHHPQTLITTRLPRSVYEPQLTFTRLSERLVSLVPGANGRAAARVQIPVDVLILLQSS